MRELSRLVFASILSLAGLPLVAQDKYARLNPATQDKYVRLNPATQDVDLAFPERLDAKDFDQNPGPLITMTVVLANHSQPKFTTTVESTGSVLTYRYVISNAPSARQAINRIYMVVPLDVGPPTCHAPSGWHCFDTPTPTDARALYYVTPEGRFVLVATPLARGNASISPGSAIAFDVQSTALPGIVSAYVESGFVEEPDLPGAVMAELHRFLTIDGSMRRCRVIAPTFASGSPIRVMARRLKDTLEQLEADRLIDRKSEFATGAMAVLGAAEASNTAQRVPEVTPHSDAERDLGAVIRYDVGDRHQ